MAEDVSGENPGAETIRKVLEHIRRIWFEPPEDCHAFHSAALTIYRSHGAPTTRLLLNWGMAVATYPNWKKDIMLSPGLYGLELDDPMKLIWYSDSDEPTSDGDAELLLPTRRNGDGGCSFDRGSIDSLCGRGGGARMGMAGMSGGGGTGANFVP